MTRSLRWSSVVVLVSCTVLTAAARQSATDRRFADQPSLVETHRINVTLEDNSSLVYQVTTRVRVQNEAGVREHGTVVVPYARDLSTLDIEYVRVRKPNGTVVDTPVRMALDVPAAVTREAPVYSDQYERHVNVQGLAAGDVVEYAYRMRNAPSFPGHASFELEFFANDISLDSEAQLSVPSGRYVNVKTHGAQPTITTESGRRIYRWRYSNVEPPTEERAYEYLRERLTKRPTVQMTTFRTWDELGIAMRDLWRGRAEVTPEIRQKAEELTKGLTTDAQKMQALFSFVSSKVRYLGVWFGIGRIQPNTAADVLRNGYGDCKDKHILLQALLTSIGISSSPVLVGLGDIIDADVPSGEQFNHVVTLATDSTGATAWMDGTIDMAPVGHLSAFARNRQGLLVASPGPPRLIPTPTESVHPNTWSLHLDGKVDDDGTLRGTISQTVTGDTAVFLRPTFRDDAEVRSASKGETQLGPSPLKGERSAVDIAALDDPTQPFVFKFTFVSKSFVDWEENELQSFLPPAMIGDAPADPKSAFPLKFGATTEQTFSFRIELPSGIVATFPKNQTSHQAAATPDFGSHRLQMRSTDRVITGQRDVRISVIELPAGRVDDYRAFHEVATASAPVITLRHEWPWTSVSTAQIQWPLGISTEANALVEKSVTASPEQAILLLEQAVKIDPRHPSAWSRLGQLQLQMRGGAQALQNLFRQIEEAPSPAAYKTLAASLPFNMRNDAARIYREAAQAFPSDRDFPALHAEALVRMGQASEAIPVLEAEIKERPRSARLHAFLGRAAAMDKQMDRAVASFKRAVELESGPNMLATAALGLADINRELDVALDYAQRAVEQTLNENVAAELPAPPLPRGMADAAARLAFYWDALGWVHFRRGDIEKAREYCLASWNISPRETSSDHLGQIEEARKDRASAARYYTHMIVLPTWRTQERVERFNRLVPLADRDRVQQEALSKPSHPPTSIPAPGATPGRTNVALLVGLDGVVRGARSMAGDAANQSAVQTLVGQRVTPASPGNAAVRLYRTGQLTCTAEATDCSFNFFVPAPTAMQ